MATTTKNEVKKTVKKLNKQAIKLSESLVEEGLATGEQWQAILAKALKNGAILADKQQDMMFDTLEEVKEQLLKGNFRFRKLFSFDFSVKKEAKKVYKKVRTAAEAIPAVDRIEKIAENLADVATEKANEAIQLVEKTFDNKVERKSAPKKVVKVGAKAASAKSAKTKAKKVAKKTSKKIVAKVAPKKAIKKTATKNTVAKKTSSKKVSLTLVEGIGPKIEGLLNAAGIKTFEQLSQAKVSELKAILTTAGSRYQMHDPSTWAAQAKLAAAGKMDVLKAYQADLKGGKKA